MMMVYEAWGGARIKKTETGKGKEDVRRKKGGFDSSFLKSAPCVLKWTGGLTKAPNQGKLCEKRVSCPREKGYRVVQRSIDGESEKR